MSTTSVKRSSSAISGTENPTELVPPYNPYWQKQPKLPFFHPLAEDAKQEGTAIILALQKLIQQHEYQSEEVKYFISWLNDHQISCYQESKFFLTLLGRSGVGKSLLLNALLGHDLAMHGNSGKSVTYVVQEFHYRRTNQVHPFEAEISFYPFEVWNETITMHFMNYLNYQDLNAKATSAARQDEYQDELEDSEDESTEGVDYNKLIEARSRATGALTVLQAIFPEKFPTREDVKLFLSKAISCNDRNNSAQLSELLMGALEIYETLFLSNTLKGEKMVYTASLPSKLKNLVRPFISEVQPPPNIPGTGLQCSLWPFVRLVRYYLDGRNLESGSVIVDTPGVTDADRSRVDETQKYIQSSDAILLTDEFGRMASEHDNFLRLDMAYRRKGPGSAILVGTNVDKIGEGHENLGLTTEEEDKMWEIQQQNREHLNEIESLEKESKNALLRKDHELALSLQEGVTQKRYETFRLNHEANDIRIKALHRRVSREVQDQYEATTGDTGKLPVFLVSSKEWFEKYLKGYSSTDPPRLSMEATGIPQLSNFIYGRPAEGKFATLQHWITGVLDDVLNRLESLSTISNLEQKAKALEYCSKSRGLAKQKIDDCFKRFLDGTLLKIVESMRKYEKTFITEAVTFIEKKEKEIKGVTHLAVLRRQGKHKTPKIAQQDWNNTFLAPVRSKLNPKFDRALGVLLNTKAHQITEEIALVIENLAKDLRNDPSAGRVVGSSTNFEAYGKTHMALVKHEVDAMRDDLQQELREIQNNATEGSGGSYFSKAMIKVYDQAIAAGRNKKKRNGVTAHSVRCETFRSAISKRNGPFSTLTREVENNFVKEIAKAKDKLIDNIDAVLRPIEDDIHREMRIGENENAKRKKWLEELVESVQKARPMLEEAKRKLEVCKREYLENE